MVVTIRKSSKKEEIEKILSTINVAKQLDVSKYCGKIKLSEDPLFIQKKLRDEWE
ncbi:MAG: hypothetical protein J7604_23785 [Sporocytophaga sp.]|uniref:hypothetical protein n=1 Tax=Sporocytophaga sp. TaxID=2231183 RepID=UPI001B29C9CE|nr:hypothetical protein [Sporocytophaga sp.]MBO9703257.1 hypothetical protein [Sporocytophaga sp.]